jgi:hypothetical protein
VDDVIVIDGDDEGHDEDNEHLHHSDNNPTLDDEDREHTHADINDNEYAHDDCDSSEDENEAVNNDEIYNTYYNENFADGYDEVPAHSIRQMPPLIERAIARNCTAVAPMNVNPYSFPRFPKPRADTPFPNKPTEGFRHPLALIAGGGRNLEVRPQQGAAAALPASGYSAPVPFVFTPQGKCQSTLPLKRGNLTKSMRMRGWIWMLHTVKQKE